MAKGKPRRPIGFKVSAETRAKISAAMTGKLRSEEAKAKISKSMKKYWRTSSRRKTLEKDEDV